MKLKTTLLLLLAVFGLYNAQAQCGAQFDEVNGVVMIQAESGNLPSGWVRETSKSGYSGSSYIAYRGPDYFNAPGNQVINYTFRINTPGTYRFQFRNTIGIISTTHDPTTEHNDSFIKISGIPAANFYAKLGNSILYPVGSGLGPNPHGSSGNGYFKVNSNNLAWNWDAYTNDGNGHILYARFDAPGVYSLQMAGRSNGHLVDQLVLFDESRVSFGNAITYSETACGGSSPPPPPPPPPPTGNNPPTVSITSPANGANFPAGSNIPVGLNSSDPDGNISLHEIFVNNTKVDTDGAVYSTHTMLNVQPGSYVITARVTDTSGATAESTINITVGSGNTPPPPPPPTGGNNPPTVAITSPANGQNFAVGSTVPVGVSASDSDGTIALHQVYVNGELVDTDGTTYTTHSIQNIAAGSYEISVTVTDNAGATASATVNITVGSGNPPPPPPTGGNNPPTVVITSPSNGQNFNVGSNVTVGVSANDTDGSVVKHQVYVNGVLVDTDPSGYTPHVIPNVPAGSHTVSVTVTDNDGATASATVSFTAGGSNTPPAGSDISVDLINASTNNDIEVISNGSTLSTGSNVNIRANTSLAGASSAFFRLTGPVSRVWTENAQPYALFGDVGGNFNGANLAGGSYTLVVEIYSGSNRTGSQLGSLTVNFSVGSGSAASSISGKGYVYPNPVENGRFSVKIPSNLKGEVGYSLITSSGAEIKAGKVNVSNEVDKVEFDEPAMNSSNDGIYYLILRSVDQRYTIPIIKQ